MHYVNPIYIEMETEIEYKIIINIYGNRRTTEKVAVTCFTEVRIYRKWCKTNISESSICEIAASDRHSVAID